MRRSARLALIAAGGLVVACSVASSGVVRPPERFQGDNWAIVTFVDIAQVDGVCRQMGAVGEGRVQGCVRGREALAKMKKALLDAEVLAQAQPVKIENMPANYFDRYMDGQVMATIYDVKTMCRNQIAPGVP